jgi:ethanolamine ammonia-lyase small subunit
MTPDAWRALRSHSGARIALGRAGGSLPTAEVLDFAMAHAAARDAVDAAVDVEAIAAGISGNTLGLHSAATDRRVYLRRPDLGRRLDERSREIVTAAAGEFDVSLVVADGLSALAVQRHACALIAELAPILRHRSLRLAPVAIVTQGRVAVQDEIGELISAAASVILIGERPGLSSPDSLGAYLVFGPRVGNTDARRNCVSNIRPDGLRIEAAAELISYLILEAIRRKISGVELKDERADRLLR